jgi:hypothetical protein
MPLEFDITQPVNNQQVGQTICVVGSFSGGAGNPFDMTCKIEGGNPAHSATVAGQINFQNETWQCTFNNVPTGIYDITAQSGGVPAQRSGYGSNPVTQVEVTAGGPVRLGGPGAVTQRPGGVRDRNTMMTLAVEGSCEAGYGLENGYVVYAYLRLAGQQVSSAGRLTAVWPVGGGSGWEYELQIPTWAWSPAAVLIVELWKLDQDPKKKHTKPVASVAQPVRFVE